MNNQVNNGSSSTSNESVQRMVDTTQSMVYRPVKTIKAYSAKQECCIHTTNKVNIHG
ncbi:hypothetical protein RO3G_15248 [Rhizopus delemar RA 99-880]|uniref:Uncharacterized protein n=1 Tax=Rhizopus delemar (strain RA 99-880 / ATCC MYA-4621 / FGSC 9543 / NRRL 43880) TaxID=246409 RepID=I1CQ07_RHIO9|nr:hypothetical protein RO3G_15248 [Rhizopus delemar RA 99-880]|eukprot:EIE90537.1 hypothetical protein RO3G_15248 [Rhizopus delemar RA 99-880]